MSKDVMGVQEVSPGYEFVAENPAVPVGYKFTDVGVIPEEWRIQQVQDFSDVGRGRVISHRAISTAITPLYPVYSSQTTNNGVMGYLDTFDFEGEYVTWTTDGANAGTVFYRDGRFNCTNVCGTIRTLTEDPRFIARILSKFAPRHVSRHLGNPKLMNDAMKRATVPLPPIQEQRAIATALSDVDALLEELDRLIAKKRDIKQAAMQQLLTGETRLPGFEGDWKPVKFSALATLSNVRIDPSKSEGSDFCIELEHINQGTGLLNGSTVTTETSSLKATFEPGDVLFGKLRAYLKKYWIASRSGVCSTEIWVLKANSQLVLSQYLFQIVTTDSFIESASTAYGTHMPRSDWKVVRETQWSIPCINEQQAIAAVLSDMDTEIQALEHRRSKTAELKQGMMQELLTGRTRLV